MSTNTALPLSEQIHARLTDRLQPTALRVIDESAAHAGHVGANDSGQGTHRLVYDALQDFIDQGLHALAIELI
jgi:BolA protein